MLCGGTGRVTVLCDSAACYLHGCQAGTAALLQHHHSCRTAVTHLLSWRRRPGGGPGGAGPAAPLCSPPRHHSEPSAFTPGLPRPDCQHWAVDRAGRAAAFLTARGPAARAPRTAIPVQPLAQCALPSAHTAPLSRPRPRRAAGLMLSHKNYGAVTTGAPGNCRQPPAQPALSAHPANWAD